MPYPKYQVYKNKSGKFRFLLYAANAKTILASEGYNTKAACLKGIASVKKMALIKTDLSLTNQRLAKKFIPI